MSPKKRPRLHRLSQRRLMDHAIRPLKSVGSSSLERWIVIIRFGAVHAHREQLLLRNFQLL